MINKNFNFERLVDFGDIRYLYLIENKSDRKLVFGLFLIPFKISVLISLI